VLELKLDIVSIVFINIKNDELLWTVLCNLAAKLRTDGTATTCNKNDLALKLSSNILLVKADWITSKDILDGDVLKVASADDAGLFSVHIWKLLDTAVCFLAKVDKVTLFARCKCSDGDVDFLYLIFFYGIKDFVAATDNLYSIDVTTPFVRVVVDDANDLGRTICSAIYKIDVAKNHTTC